jgi:hypothetical protein
MISVDLGLFHGSSKKRSKSVETRRKWQFFTKNHKRLLLTAPFGQIPERWFLSFFVFSGRDPFSGKVGSQKGRFFDDFFNDFMILKLDSWIWDIYDFIIQWIWDTYRYDFMIL